jgi:hypothetical protein
MPKHSIATTSVSETVVYCDGKLLAEMSDGELIQFNIYRAPKTCDLEHWGALGWRFKTKTELAQMVHEMNVEHMLGCRTALHEDKVRRLGWDYASRGY